MVKTRRPEQPSTRKKGQKGLKAVLPFHSRRLRPPENPEEMEKAEKSFLARRLIMEGTTIIRNDGALLLGLARNGALVARWFKALYDGIKASEKIGEPVVVDPVDLPPGNLIFSFAPPAKGKERDPNGVAERFNRTLKEQVIHGRVFKNLEELRRAVAAFVERYNNQWRVEKLGFRTPFEAREDHALRAAA